MDIVSQFDLFQTDLPVFVIRVDEWCISLVCPLKVMPKSSKENAFVRENVKKEITEQVIRAKLSKRRHLVSRM